MMTIGQVAKKVGVNVETIRFYERNGLIPQPQRSDSGYRLFDEDTVNRLAFIQHAKALGFSLQETGELLSLRLTKGQTCASVKKQASRKLDELNKKIQALENMKSALMPLIEQCQSNAEISDCPILQALEHKGQHHAES